MFKDFRDFIMRGNVIDLAVGIIIGAAFTTVVNSLVNDIIMPPIGYITGGTDFSELAIVLGTAEGGEEAVAAINYGLFINAIINFLIVGFSMFLVVRGFNVLMERARRDELEEPPPPEATVDEKILETLETLNKTLRDMNNS